jgi:MFS family permease
MLNHLKISYSTIALLNNLSMILLVGGYQFWGRVVDRHGSAPILRFMMVFRMLIPLLWACVTPEIAFYMLPFIMVVQGVTFSGLTSANSPLLYKLVSPEKDGATEDDPMSHRGMGEVTGFFAIWSASSQLAAAVSSAIAGGIIKVMEGHVMTLGGIEIGGLQLVFLLSAAIMILPNLLLRRVEEPGASTVKEMLTRKRQ